MIAAAAAGAALHIVRAPSRPRIALVASATALVTAGALALVWPRFVGKNDPYAFSRAAIWRETAELALAHPLGVSLGNYRNAMRRHGVPLDGPARYPKLATDAHSEPLHVFAELGWLGLGATLLPLPLLAAAIWRRRRDSDAPPAWSDAATLATFAVPAAVATSMHVPPIAFLAAIWAGGVARRDPTPSAERLVPSGAWRVATAVTLTALLLAAPGALSWRFSKAAERARQGGDLDRAMSRAEWAARLAPWSPGAAVALESLRLARGDPPLEVAERLIDLADRFPESTVPLERAGWLTERAVAEVQSETTARALWQAAQAIYIAAAQRSPKDALLLADVARVQLALGDTSGAAETLEQALELEPNCARALALAAHSASLRGDTRAAAAFAARASHAPTLIRSGDPDAARILSLPDSFAKMLPAGSEAQP